jgi:hypothetical protein
MRNPVHPEQAEGLAVDARRDTSGTYVSMDGGRTWNSTSEYADWHIRDCLIYLQAVEDTAERYLCPDRLLRVVQNPFCTTAFVRYSVRSENHVSLDVFDARGALVAVLVDGYQESGSYRTRWSAGEQPDGVYFSRLQIGDLVETTKMIKLE